MTSKIIVALDYEKEEEALCLVDQIDPSLCRLKVGKEMFTTLGTKFVKALHDRNFDVFLDLKFHDIPNTVARAVRSAADLGVWMVDLHASGGLRMMEEAKKILEPYGKDAPLLISVTVLTSMEDLDLLQIGINASPMEQVIRLANLTQRAGLDGVVCSPQEVEILRANCGKDFKLITPGIRPIGSDFGDQRRVMTPAGAIQAGSDYLVIGRPITQADNPAEVLKSINASLPVNR
ncbi:orotidine-5'-phosphate decarboxylase [Pasteurella multocida]|uniref:Orotidine 5'-phosphate decarboxylase n=1 Tax=Pasteurella multocida (strain Pm70) TaxID=272843 RepID=PYRF_PASMU|nr:orotidine-5'-phosphate decarboxylase [Pasteurella multocida]Q9CMM1.1 RecName: Full=Orotidine 5'-phosphate decarboxylase; AltName: Full=OMP decarboxylase; Short=OMPDCase; Short=OMPdecase [Pasteurella multocida subsp. multocida str. Pm70]AAK02881.1 PyrF [Pasteurella multocida subsp. multocida str. Pm70]APW55400.1 orotidine 5'-phosphate decarboxylase [Pasteurella multocida subsp. multocida str. HN07]ARA69059.1 orotidine 5'-phosphate decarboxylase [Pasteurella multocida subsp. multocida]ARA8912